MRIAFLSVLLLAMAYPASAQPARISYGVIEGVWVAAAEDFDAEIDPSKSDCELIKADAALTISGRAIYGQGFNCAVRNMRVYYQEKVFAYASCSSVNGDPVLRRYTFSMYDGLLYVELSDMSPGLPRTELYSSNSIYRRAKCNTAG